MVSKIYQNGKEINLSGSSGSDTLIMTSKELQEAIENDTLKDKQIIKVTDDYDNPEDISELIGDTKNSDYSNLEGNNIVEKIVALSKKGGALILTSSELEAALSAGILEENQQIIVTDD